jgi:hypothetical protein
MCLMKHLTLLTLAVSITLAATGVSWSQATWDGPTGVFLNPLALTLGQGLTQASVHYLDLQPAGSLTTYGVEYGVNQRLEVGLTEANLAVGGANALDILNAKYVVRPVGGKGPGVAVGTVLRSAHGGDNTSDFYVVATQVFPTKAPIIASVTVRSTNGLGSGLFGKADDRSTQLGGVLAVQARPNLILAVEYFDQPEAPAWKDLAVRYVVSPNTFLDAGLADLNDTFGNQIALAVTHQFRACVTGHTERVSDSDVCN